MPDALVEPIGMPPHDRALWDKLRAKRVTLQFQDVPLGNAGKRVQDALDLTVLFDWPALEEEGIGQETPVSANLKDVRADHALSRLLNPLNLAWLVQNDVLLVTTATKAGEQLVVGVYPVADLVVSDTAGVAIDAQPIIDLIQQTVEPNSWGTVGGAGTIDFFPGTLSLVFSQTQEIHDEVARTLNLLRASRNPGQPAPQAEPRAFRDRATNAPLGVTAEASEILRTLSTKRLSLDFQATPLGKAVELLTERIGLGMSLDGPALEEEGITLETPLTLTLRDARASDVLDLLMPQLNLDWLVRHGELFITTFTKAGETLETRAYPVADLVVVAVGDRRWSVHDESLVELVQAAAKPNSWNCVGGAGSVEYFAASQCLVVRQTRRIHDQITALLSALRESADRLPAIAAAAGISIDRLQQHWTSEIRRTERERKAERRQAQGGAGIGRF